MTKAESLLRSLLLAKEKYKEALSFEDTEPLRESLIQRFEYTVELCWKLMAAIIALEDVPVAGTRNVIRAAARFRLIDNPERWLEFADHRNRTSHLYLEAVARMVADSIRVDFLDNVEKFLEQARVRI
ncbi:MAG: nucleotidyltransferase substrate binding protein [Chthonomonadales bacterium]|nr:nucleotidyltransferase substrate binding protein [Chthonomonadales bacterium]